MTCRPSAISSDTCALGQVYRRKDLARWSNAVDRHVRQLVDEGRLEKVSAGVYMAPRQTRFGAAPAKSEKLVETFLGDDRFLMVPPNAFNGLGVGTTQLYDEPVVYNRKRHGKFTLDGRLYDFRMRPSVPKRLPKKSCWSICCISSIGCRKTNRQCFRAALTGEGPAGPVVEPGNECVHLGWHRLRRRSLEMHLGRGQGSRDDLHRIGMSSISAYVGEVALAVHEQRMPLEQHGIADRFAIAAEEVCHQFGRTGFCSIGAAVVGLDPQMFRHGRLYARAIKDLALDCGTVDSFLRHEIDGTILAIIGIEVGHDTDKDTGTLQKPVLTASQALRIIGEVRPIGLLPVPTRDR